jgi:hypothetical protein
MVHTELTIPAWRATGVGSLATTLGLRRLVASLARWRGQASGVLDRMASGREHSGLNGTSTRRRPVSYLHAWTTSCGWLPARGDAGREQLRLNKEIEHQHDKQQRRDYKRERWGDWACTPSDRPAARKGQRITARGHAKGR